MKDSCIPKNFDFLSVDIDGDDIHIVSSLKEYKPKVICIEVDARDEKYKINDPTPQASILAVMEILENKGYVLVYNNAGNCFFVDNKYINEFQKLDIENYILEQLSIISKDELLFDKSSPFLHHEDMTKLKSRFLDYAKGDWKSFYPYILNFEI